MPDELALRVVEARWEAEGITSFVLAAPGGGALPAWEPGAHLDLHLPSGLVRQYSLCGDPADDSRYRIAVLAQPAGRGGSMEAHAALRPGTLVTVGPPRQNFPLVDADRYVFVAGGIGITPLLPMIRSVAARDRSWELFYGSSGHFAFTTELSGPVRLLPGLLDLDAVVAAAAGAVIYACGPAGMLDALAARVTDGSLHLERFSAPIAPAGDSFEVELARSGTVVTVGPDSSVLDAIRASGTDVPSSCEMGFCGTCETKVLAGAVDHRDDLLTEDERAAGGTMMICVSRAACPRLVLDL